MVFHHRAQGLGDRCVRGEGSLESQDGKLILTAEDKTRATLAVNAGRRHISFRLVKLENVPKDSEPVLNFRLNFINACPQLIPFDYMCITSGKWHAIRCIGTASWPFLWKRGDRDPLGRPLPSSGEDRGPLKDMLPSELAIERARQILEMLRSRAGETGLPKFERDYIERLLKGLY